jgi:hypothetical protein
MDDSMKKPIVVLCVFALVKASNLLDSRQIVWLPVTRGTVNGYGYELGLAPDGTVVWHRVR